MTLWKVISNSVRLKDSVKDYLNQLGIKPGQTESADLDWSIGAVWFQKLQQILKKTKCLCSLAANRKQRHSVPSVSNMQSVTMAATEFHCRSIVCATLFLCVQWWDHNGSSSATKSCNHLVCSISSFVRIFTIFNSILIRFTVWMNYNLNQEEEFARKASVIKS